MNILVQKDVSDLSSRKVFAQISTEALTLKDVILSIKDIIDDERNGYHRLPLLDAKSESLQRLDIYTSLRRERADKAYVISNGRNTIYLLDYVVKTRRIYHDPVLCIIGPEAEEIAEHALKRLSKILLSKMYRIELNDEAVRDFSKLVGCEKREVIKHITEIFEEAKMALKMRLLEGDVEEEDASSSAKGLSEELLRDIDKRTVSREPLDFESIIPFVATMVLIVLLLIILMRI